MFAIVFKKFKSDFKKVKIVFNKFFGALLLERIISSFIKFGKIRKE